MKWMLETPGISFPKKINYRDKILMIGSCFSQEIGNKLKELKFTVEQNPNGILYDSLSISRSINSYIEKKIYNSEDLFYRDELWHSWQYHSAFSGMDKNEVLYKINESQNNAYQFINDANWIIITLGSSFYYELLSGEAVANCHKTPGSSFNKKMLSINENMVAISNSIEKLRIINPDIKIIFTVSPIRHIRDGVVMNNRSKARLIETVHLLTEKFENVFYFPAYEIIIDILRDYRFYKEDLLHPSDTAIEYVLKIFLDSIVEKEDLGILEEIQLLGAAKNHLVFHPGSKAHTQFKNIHFTKVNSLQVLYPHIDFSEEIKYFGE